MDDETTDASSGILGSIFDLAKSYSTPFVQSLATGQKSDKANENAVFDERLNWNSLNGSGPVDPSASKQAPLSLLDYITGSKSAPASNAQQSSGGGNMLLIGGLVLLGGALLWIVAKR